MLGKIRKREKEMKKNTQVDIRRLRNDENQYKFHLWETQFSKDLI